MVRRDEPGISQIEGAGLQQQEVVPNGASHKPLVRGLKYPFQIHQDWVSTLTQGPTLSPSPDELLLLGVEVIERREKPHKIRRERFPAKVEGGSLRRDVRRDALTDIGQILLTEVDHQCVDYLIIYVT